MLIRKIKLLILGVIISSSFGCAAQQLYMQEPLENYIDYYDNDNLENAAGTYFKDINNHLDKYVGTWVGAYNNQTYTFVIEEYTDNTGVLKFDKLRLWYSIKDANNTIIEDIMSFPNSSPYIVDGWYISENEKYYTLHYRGEDAKCGQSGTFYLTPFDNNTKLRFWYNLSSGTITSRRCPNGLAEQDFPVGELVVLIKQ